MSRLLVSSLLVSTMLADAAQAQKVMIPDNNQTVTIKGQSFTVQRHKIIGTLFGKQVWIRVEKSPEALNAGADCQGDDCWLYLGKL